MTDSSPPDDLERISATEAKASFGAILDRVMLEGRLAITKHDEVRAVLLSVRQYEALLAGQRDSLKTLASEFDALVEHMQTPTAREAGRALFDATPQELGKAAKAARER